MQRSAVLALFAVHFVVACGDDEDGVTTLAESPKQADAAATSPPATAGDPSSETSLREGSSENGEPTTRPGAEAGSSDTDAPALVVDAGLTDGPAPDTASRDGGLLDSGISKPEVDAAHTTPSSPSEPSEFDAGVTAQPDTAQPDTAVFDTAQSDESALPLLADSGVALDAGSDPAPRACTAEGTWTLGDGNLFVVIDGSCVITNFCDIANVIHSRGTLIDDELLVDSVAGQLMSFMYSLTADTLTIIDGFGDVDLPLTRTAATDLPVDCFEPE